MPHRHRSVRPSADRSAARHRSAARPAAAAGGQAAPLGELVYAARRRQGLSQRALGALLRTADKPDGVWSTYIGQVEKGLRIPPDSLVLQLADVLELEPVLVLAAAYQSRACTPVGQGLFAIAPLLLWLQRHGAGTEQDQRTVVEGLQRLAAVHGQVAGQRLLQALTTLQILDERRWHLWRNALAAVRASRASATRSDAGEVELAAPVAASA